MPTATLTPPEAHNFAEPTGEFAAHQGPHAQTTEAEPPQPETNDRYIGRHRRSLGGLAYRLAVDHGNRHLKATAHGLARREEEGDPNASHDAQAFIDLMNQRPGPPVLGTTLSGWRDTTLPPVERPDINQIARSSHNYPPEATLYPGDFWEEPAEGPNATLAGERTPTQHIPQQRAHR